MFTPEQLQGLSQSEMEQDLEFNIPSGDDSDSLWQDMVNLRPQIDGRYVFSKFRGGSSAIQTQAGTIQTDSFTVDLGQGSKKYYIIVDNVGNVYLKLDGGDKFLILSGFTAGAFIEFHVNGKFIYAFEHGGAVRKYYDLIEETSHNFHSANNTRITSAALGGTAVYEEDNVFGFREGETVIVLPARFGAEGFPIEDIPPFVARVSEMRLYSMTYKNADIFEGVQLIDSSGATDNALPYNADLEDLIGTASRRGITIYRGYMIIDMLNDGSYMMPSRPEYVSITETQITSNRYSHVKLHLTVPSNNVKARYLAATRWQYTTERVFEPSSERHPNSPFYLCGEVSADQSVHLDRTADRALIRPLSELIPIRAGVPTLFHPEGITFNTTSGIKGSLITGNYTINRPTPQAYTSKAAPGNCLVQSPSGNDLGEVALAFEYTDGKKSAIVDTGINFTDAEEEVTPAIQARNAFAMLKIGNPEFSDAIGDGDPDNSGEVAVSLGDAPNVQAVSVTYSKGNNFGQSGDDSRSIQLKLINAINQNATGYIAVESFSTVDMLYQVKVMRETPGSGGNGTSVRAQFSETIRINSSGTGSVQLQMEGGIDGEAATLRASSTVQIHSLNALVAKVFVLLKVSGVYRVFREIEADSSHFHGDPMRLLSNSQAIGNLEALNTWGASDILTQVTISSGLTLSVPFQQFRIDRQFRAHSSYAIQKLIPLRFDVDRTQLRYQLMAVTDSDVQLGYLTGQGDTFEATFEPTDDSVEITDPKRVKKVNGQTFVRTEEGLHRFGQGGLELILPRDRYDVLANDLYDVAYNTRHGEYWFCFGDSIVLVFKNGLWYQMRYPVDVFSLQFAFGMMSIGLSNGLYRTDNESQFTDGIGSSYSIKADLVSRHLGSELTQMRLFDFQVNGLGANAELFMDSQLARYEGDTSTWQKVFDSTYNYSSQTLKMNGAIWEINERAIMPRLKVEATALQSQAMISNSVLKGYITDNKNIARK